MMYPLLTLNGSHGPSLLQEYCEAGHAVQEAITRMEQLDVHGRDYQTMGPTAFAVAHEEWSAG
jgi:hypothetical protein